MDRLHLSWSSTSSTTKASTTSAPARPGRRGSLLVAIREAGLVAVVAVGDHDRVRGDGVAIARRPRPGRHCHSSWRDAVVVGPAASGRSASSVEQLGEARRGRQPPHRRQVRLVARSRSSRSLLAFGRGVLVGQDAALAGARSARARRSRRSCGGGRRSRREGHAVQVEATGRRRRACRRPATRRGGVGASRVGVAALGHRAGRCARRCRG